MTKCALTPKAPQKTLIIGVAIASILFVSAVIFSLWARGYSYEVKNETYQSLKDVAVIRLFIPPEAESITGWLVPYHVEIVVAFKISENDFRQWAKKKGWKLKEIQDTEVRSISRVGNPNDRVTIENGLLYKWVDDRNDPSSTIRIYVYDITNRIGYFTQLGD